MTADDDRAISDAVEARRLKAEEEAREADGTNKRNAKEFREWWRHMRRLGERVFRVLVRR